MFPRFSASFARGVGQSGRRKSRGDRPPERIAKAFVLLASGVGNNPRAVTDVRGTNGGCRYAIPPRIVPARGQVPENDVEASPEKRGDIFHDDEAGSKLANETGVLAP